MNDDRFESPKKTMKNRFHFMTPIAKFPFRCWFIGLLNERVMSHFPQLQETIPRMTNTIKEITELVKSDFVPINAYISTD